MQLLRTRQNAWMSSARVVQERLHISSALVQPFTGTVPASSTSVDSQTEPLTSAATSALTSSTTSALTSSTTSALTSSTTSALTSSTTSAPTSTTAALPSTTDSAALPASTMSTNPTTQNGAGSSSAGPSSVASSSAPPEPSVSPAPDVTTHTSTRSPTHSATNGNTPHTSSLIGLVSTSIGPTETSILDLPSGQIGESHSSALSTAAVIGTAVGILGCAILTLIMGVYIIRRKRRQRSDMHEQTLTEIFKETSMPGSTGPPSSPASPSVSHDVAHFPMRSNIQAFSGRPTSNVQSGIIVMQPVGIVSGDDDAIYAAYQNQQQQQQMQQQQMQQMQHMQHLDHLTMQQSMNMQQADRAAFPVFPGGTQAGYGYMTPQDPNHNRGAAMTSMESPLYGSNGYPTRPPSPTGYSSYYDNYQSIYTTLHPSATNHLSYQEEPHVYMLDGNGIVSPRIQGDDMAAGPLSPLAMNVDTRPDSESSSGGDQDVHTNHQSSDTLSRLISLTRAASFEAGSSLPRTGVSNNMNAPPSLPLPR
ncbi:hypothetical protein BSLG_002099 [Batrachochytrium salamandrivorans]|nr:hypothetical protein BSLG_002099 [Batrachochytrium salamandrivorans]